MANLINNDLFKLGNLGTFQNVDVTEYITRFTVSLTLSGSSELSVTVVDPNFVFAKNNYFQIRRDIFYRGMYFEIAAIEVERSPALHPQYNLKCRSKGVQLMKQDKRPEQFNGISGFDLALRMAKRFGMGFYGEQTTKKQATIKAKSSNKDDSVWTVLNSAAGEQEFVLFETENTLFFTSEKYLLGKWGDPNFGFGDFKVIPYIWPEPTATNFPQAVNKYILFDMPSVRRSDDDLTAVEGSMIVERSNGINLRPGMTVYIGGIPDFEAAYLITDVSFEEGVPDPVQVQFRTPVEPEKGKTVSSGTVGGGSFAGSSGTGTGNTGSIGAPPVDEGNDFEGTVSGQNVTAKKYTQQVLARLTNASFIIGHANAMSNQVNASVAQFIEGRRDWDTIQRAVKRNTSITPTEQNMVLEIITAYLFGESSENFAKRFSPDNLVSDELYTQRLAALIRGDAPPAVYTKYGTEPIAGSAEQSNASAQSWYLNPSTSTNVTPASGTTTTSSTSSATRPPLGSQEAWTTVYAKLNTYFQTNIDRSIIFTACGSKQSRVDKALAFSRRIYDKPTYDEKLAELNKIRTELNTKECVWWIFNALKTVDVLKLIFPLRSYPNGNATATDWKDIPARTMQQ